MRQCFVLLVCISFLFSCGERPSSSTTYVAMDPTWQPLNLQGNQAYVQGFTFELLSHVSEAGKQPITLLTTSSDEMLTGLQSGLYDGILSSLEPAPSLEAELNFSNPYL